MPAIGFALLLSLFVAPWQGLTDEAGSVLPASASAAFDPATIRLLNAGFWWRAEPDYSSFLVLHEAFARGLPQRQLVFTFGPWGFLYRGYHPGTFAAQLVAWTFIAFATAAALWRIAVFSFATIRSRVLWTLAAVLLVAVSPRESILLLMPFLLAVLCHGRLQPPPPLVIWLATACALAGLVKLSALVLGLAILLVVTGHDLYRRRMPWALFGYGGGIVFFWLLAGRGLVELPGFVRSSAQLLGGYTDASSLSGHGAPEALLAVLLVAIASIAVVGVAEYREASWKALFPVAATALTLLSAIKAGFVRSDPYHLPTTMVTVGAVSAVIAANYWSRWKYSRALGAGSVCVAVALLAPHLGALAEIGPQSAAAVRLPGVKRESDRRFAAEMASIRSRNPIRLQGSVDIYPHRQSIVIANGSRYDPRPVFQSYIAWSRELAERNARHLRGAEAPEFLLFEVRPVDGRLSSIEDGLSWPEILSRYQLISGTGSLLVLQRRGVGQAIEFAPVGSLQGRFGERIAVPPHDGMLWAGIDLRSTGFGMLSSWVFRSPLVLVTLEFRDGSTRTQRLIPKLGSGGFLLSPHIVNSDSFAALLLRSEALRNDYGVVAIRVTSEASYPALFIRNPFTVTFSALSIGASETASAPLAGNVNPIIGPQ